GAAACLSERKDLGFGPAVGIGDSMDLIEQPPDSQLDLVPAPGRDVEALRPRVAASRADKPEAKVGSGVERFHFPFHFGENFVAASGRTRAVQATAAQQLMRRTPRIRGGRDSSQVTAGRKPEAGITRGKFSRLRRAHLRESPAGIEAELERLRATRTIDSP